ncbi:MAG: hypothetical protein M9918_00890 [Anaerolineae bacterium]|nr:hypothetical protein [Anaerolineae bacterium]
MRLKVLYTMMLLLGFVLVVTTAHGFASNSAENTISRSTVYAAPESDIANCRYGATLTAGESGFEELGAGWYLDFYASPTIVPTNGAEYAHGIRVSQDKTDTGVYLSTYRISPPLTDGGLGQVIDDHPGGLYLIGNEPDRGPDPGSLIRKQDDTFPEIYAQAYHDAYYYIKERDPSAEVAIAGLVQVTPGRLQYLDIVWDTYRDLYGHPMPVDVFNMHLYVLSETDRYGNPNDTANVALGTDPALGKRSGTASECSLDQVYCIAEHDNIDRFAEQVVAMREWMKAHGQQNKPLILSEFSSLYSPLKADGDPFLDEYGNQFTIARIKEFMDATVDYMSNTTDPNLGYEYDDYRLVQQWMWFSMHSERTGWGSNLLQSDKSTLNWLGQTYRDHIHDDPYNADLLVGNLSHHVGTFSSGKADVSLSADIHNKGTRKQTASITVQFYKNAALTQMIGDPIVITPDLGGCARESLNATTTWSNLTPGIYTYWVKVVEASDEDDLSDNVRSGTFILDESPTYLPVATR